MYWYIFIYSFKIDKGKHKQTKYTVIETNNLRASIYVTENFIIFNVVLGSLGYVYAYLHVLSNGNREKSKTCHKYDQYSF